MKLLVTAFLVLLAVPSTTELCRVKAEEMEVRIFSDYVIKGNIDKAGTSANADQTLADFVIPQNAWMFWLDIGVYILLFGIFLLIRIRKLDRKYSISTILAGVGGIIIFITTLTGVTSTVISQLSIFLIFNMLGITTTLIWYCRSRICLSRSVN